MVWDLSEKNSGGQKSPPESFELKSSSQEHWSLFSSASAMTTHIVRPFSSSSLHHLFMNSVRSSRYNARSYAFSTFPVGKCPI